MSFKRNDRVVVGLDSGQRVGGRITGKQGANYRVVTDSYKRLKVSGRRLRRGSDDVLLLEARLDRPLRSHRHQGTFMKEFLEPLGRRVLYEKVHTKEDLKRFLAIARRDPTIPYVHYVGHGEFRGEAKLKLTFERVDLRKDADIFSDLGGKVLIFSCCTVGRDRAAMRHLLKVSKARAIICYDKDIDDAYAFVTEALLYNRMFDTLRRPSEVVSAVKRALRSLRVTREYGQRETRSPVVCFSAN